MSIVSRQYFVYIIDIALFRGLSGAGAGHRDRVHNDNGRVFPVACLDIVSRTLQGAPTPSKPLAILPSEGGVSVKTRQLSTKPPTEL